jgi:hypothetical protein
MGNGFHSSAVSRALLLAAHVNRDYLPSAVPLNKTASVAVLHGGVLAVSCEKDGAEEVRDCGIAIDPSAEIINLSLCDRYILSFDLRDILGFVGYLAVRPGSDVIVGKQSFEDGCIASDVSIGGLLYQGK